MIDFYKITARIMMKKNLFLLFSFYFFVVQAILLGLLRGEINFFWLAVVNFVFIGFVALISKEKNEKNNIDAKKINDIEKTSKSEKIHKIQKKKNYKPISHVWFFIISLLFGFFVWFWLGDIVLHLQLLITVIVSFILFIIFGLLFKFKAFRVRESKLYIIGLIILLAWSAIKMFNINLAILDSEGQIDEVEITGNIAIGVIVTGLENLFVPVDEDIINDNGSRGTELLMEVSYFDEEDLDKKATFGDVIKYLIDTNEVEFNTKQNIKFTYVPYSNVDYPYYRTAYDQKMIGKTLNPTKNLFCETYIVMKGLAEERSVGSYSDIKLAYWNYTKANSDLPSCEYGNYVKLGDLK